jgi:hypothetical protein
MLRVDSGLVAEEELERERERERKGEWERGERYISSPFYSLTDSVDQSHGFLLNEVLVLNV